MMPTESKHCDDARIEQFLRADLSDAELVNVEQHVEGCDACRMRLQSMAADAKWWDDANEFLTSDTHDLDLKEADPLSGFVDRDTVATSDDVGEDTDGGVSH